MELEFTTTACNRPEILEKTYQSFTSKLKGVNFRKSTLYINIDPAPDKKNIQEVEKVAKKYFGKVVANYPINANFAKAVIWCFQQVKKDIFFHLEDDWLLNREVDLQKVLFFCSKHLNWHQCVFQKKNIQQANEPCLLPSLHNTQYTKIYLKLMNSKINPEAQMKYIHRNNQITGLTYIIWDKNLVQDIGKKWLLQKGLRRNYAEISKKKGWTPWVRWTMEIMDSIDGKRY